MSVQSIMSYSAPQAPNTSCVPNMAMEKVGMSREGISVGSSNQFGSSQEVGDPGWLMAIADSMVTSSEQSRHMISVQSCSQELQRPKPGESGLLVSITDCLEEGRVDKMKQHLKEKSVKPFSQQPMDMFSVQSSRQDVHRPTPSQDSGKGNSIPSQAVKTYHSQVSSLQSSVSSASELLASDEDTSRVILYKEEVAEQCQANPDQSTQYKADMVSCQRDNMEGNYQNTERVLDQQGRLTKATTAYPQAQPLVDKVVSELMKHKLGMLMSQYPSGLAYSQLSASYRQQYGEELDPLTWGQTCGLELCCQLSDVVQIQPLGRRDWLLLSARPAQGSSLHSEEQTDWSSMSQVADSLEVQQLPHSVGPAGCVESLATAVRSPSNVSVQLRNMQNNLYELDEVKGSQPAVGGGEFTVVDIDPSEDSTNAVRDANQILSKRKAKNTIAEDPSLLEDNWNNSDQGYKVCDANEASQRLASPPVNQTATNSIILASEDGHKVSTFVQSSSNTPKSSSHLSTHISHGFSLPSSHCSSRCSQTVVTESVKAASTPPTVSENASTNETNADKSSGDISAAAKMIEVCPNQWRRSGWSKGLGLKGGGGASGDKKKTSKSCGIKTGGPKVRESNPDPASLDDEHVLGGPEDVAVGCELGNVRGRSAGKTEDHQCKCGKTFLHQRSLSRHFVDCTLNENNPFIVPQPLNAPSPRKRTSKRTIINSPLTPHTSGAKLGKEDPNNNSSIETSDNSPVFEVFEEDDHAVKLLSSKYKDYLNFYKFNFNYLTFSGS